MKKFFSIIFLVLFIITNSFSQNTNSTTNIIGKSFVSKAVIPVKRFNPFSNDIVTDSKFLLNEDTKFSIYSVTDSGYIISIWNYQDSRDSMKYKFYSTLTKSIKSDSSALNEQTQVSNGKDYTILKKDLGFNSLVKASDALGVYEQLAYLDSWANNLQFFISLKDFNDKCEPIYPKTQSFTWGFLTLPIKARIGTDNAPFTFEEKINFGISFGYKQQRLLIKHITYLVVFQ
jgi:hypothetical protein